MKDDFFMEQALKEAQKAFELQEVPIGAVVVNDDGIVIACGFNRVESERSQLYHAELCALRQATDSIGDWRLEGCTVYVTLEPCLMCYAALKISRVKGIVFGAYSPLFGYKAQKDTFLGSLDKEHLFIKGGVKKEECANILKKFFKHHRTDSLF